MAQVSITTLIAAVRSGDRLISFPTDTVPALAARPDRAELIFTTKQRSHDKPLILMAGQPEDLWPFVSGSTTEFQCWQQVVERYWPGALTLVLPASSQVPAAMNPMDPTTIGIRVPDHALARDILLKSGPLATTSVNRSGEPALETLTEINQQFPQILTPEATELLPYGITPETRASGVPSTVAKWTEQGWKILRQGGIKLEEG